MQKKKKTQICSICKNDTFIAEHKGFTCKKCGKFYRVEIEDDEVPDEVPEQALHLFELRRQSAPSRLSHKTGLSEI
jgi:ribosomal protein S27AE